MALRIWLSVALLGAVAAPARPSSKSAATLNIAVLSGNVDLLSDLCSMGARMAAAEVNTNASLLPDATVAVTSVSLPLFDADPAAFYDLAVDLCDNGGYHAYFSSVLDNMAFATSLVCPNMPVYAGCINSPLFDDRHLFPLFQRQIESMTQDLQIMIAQFKYFGWTRTAILFNTNDVWIKTARNARQMFSQNGISVLASIQMAEYDPSISTMYYPQIQNVFEFLKSTRLRIFFALVDQVADVMMAANRTGIAGRDYVWMTDAPDFHTPDLAERWDTPWDPMLIRGIGIPFFYTGPLFDDPYFVDWKPRFVNFTTYEITNEPYLYATLNLNQTDATLPDYPANYGYDDPVTRLIPSLFLRQGYDSAMRLALAVDKLVADAGSTAQAYTNGSISSAMTLARLSVLFEGTRSLTGISLLSSDGNPIPDVFTWQQFDGTTPLGGWGIVTADIEIDPITGEGKFMPDKAKFMWAGNRSFDDVPRDYPPIVEDYVSLGNRGTLAMLATSSVLLLACLTAATWIARHAKSPQIIPHSPALLIVMMIGLAVMQLDGFTMVGRDNALACRLRPWPVVLGLTLVLTSILQRGILLLGIFQVVLYPRVTWLGSMRSAKGTIIAFTPGTLTIILLVVLTAAAPMTSTQVYIEAFDGYRFVCDSTPTTSAIMSLITALIVIQLVAAAALAFLGRDMPDLFNTTQHVFVSVVVIAVLGGICLLQGNSVKSMQTQFYFESACAGIGAVLVFVVMIASRIGTILSQLSFGDKTTLPQSAQSRRMSRSVTSGDSESSDEGSRRLSASRRLSTLGRPQPKPREQEKVQPQRTHERDYDIEVQPKTHEVVAVVKAFKSPLVMAVPMRTEGMLQQWRTAMIVLIGAPVFCLRIADKRRTSIEYLPLHRLKRIVNHTSDALVGSHQCEVVFSKRRLVLSFGDTARAQAWADMVARTTLALCSREVKAVSDGCVVRSMALKQASKRASIAGKHAPHTRADSS